jgi:hypothetical protein
MKPIYIPQVFYGDSYFICQTASKPSFLLLFILLFLKKLKFERLFIPQGVGADCRLLKNAIVRDPVLPLW